MKIENTSYVPNIAKTQATQSAAPGKAGDKAVSVSPTTVTEDTYVPGKKPPEDGAVGYKPSRKLSADFIENLEKQSQELMRSLAEKMISAQRRKAGGSADTGLNLSSLTQALGLGAGAGMSDIQSLVDGLHLGVDVSGMSYGEIANTLGIGTTPESAAAAISEDGMWGVNAVSTRLIDFAMSLAGGDPEKLAELREAVTKGFEAVGDISSLPQVCQDTYAETMARFDYWEEQLAE